MAGRLIAVVLALLAVPATAAAQAPPESLRTDGAHVVDAAGGTVLLRGTAVIDKFRDGIPDVGPADFERMRALGFNSIRLGTAWEWIEPRRGEYDLSLIHI